MPTSLSWTLVDVVDTPPQQITAQAQAGLVATKNFKLTAAGELDFSGGQLRFTAGAIAIMQSLGLRLQAVTGEWFLNVLLGLPLFTEIIGEKNPDLIAIRTLYRDTILGTPGVLDILSLTLSLDTARSLTINFAVSTDFGELVATGVATP